jgi:multiple sugar transport system ATP-binding protein
MASVCLDNVRKVYPNGQVAVEGANFEVREGELLVLVGPSGCGKSTLLRMIAGLEPISGGTLTIGGRVVNQVSPVARDIAMVFQNYALYPHMSVAQNLGFGLRLRGTPRAARRRRVAEAADMLGLTNVLEQRPAQLSGGQRQRVALGRALVREPAVFLLDEPLSNLDARLRLSMRVEIARLHRRLGTTMIYVTHDQVEAMTLGERIVALDCGVIRQVDTPMSLYAKPADLFVAGFIGSPAMNLWRGRLCGDRLARLELGNGNVLPLGVPAAALRGRAGDEVVVGLRPEDFKLAQGACRGDLPSLRAQLELIEPVGADVYLNLRYAGMALVARIAPQALPERGATLTFTFDPARLHFFDAASGARMEIDAGAGESAMSARYNQSFHVT